ncbi:hypothetical protein M409DRAFT_55364 [Zasmidium cellare ATCC 36951]|uniref:Uncharacterized protein n=1 Tax=Zasmidium cellare ATCC 36951 TaxID=1080233 RepID=A0A6A6CH89_ZASCE|nr:uncharacterized protein M409DRAFT_55364 [Zasmidium cellare ATCC 36951]KAF2166013.1 hypothetical protein M409DRAFT_55364 [Zasmidium cellare ATCC 36951]
MYLMSSPAGKSLLTRNTPESPQTPSAARFQRVRHEHVCQTASHTHCILRLYLSARSAIPGPPLPCRLAAESQRSYGSRTIAIGGQHAREDAHIRDHKHDLELHATFADLTAGEVLKKAKREDGRHKVLRTALSSERKLNSNLHDTIREGTSKFFEEQRERVVSIFNDCLKGAKGINVALADARQNEIRSLKQALQECRQCRTQTEQARAGGCEC